MKNESGKILKIKQYMSDHYTRSDLNGMLICLVSMIAGIIFLSVTICAAPAGDDRYNLTMQYYNISHQSFWTSIKQYYSSMLDSFLLKNGRFFPMLFPADYIRFWFKSSVAVYRIYIIIYTYVDILLIAILTSKVLKNRSIGRVFFCLMPLLIGVWSLVDTNAMYSYEALVQATLFPMLLSGLCTIQYSATKKKRYIVLAAITAFYSCATYELGFILIIPIFGLVWIYENNLVETLKKLIPAFCGEAFALLMNVLCRLAHMGGSKEGVEYGVQFNLDFAKMFPAFKYQFKAGLPLLSMRTDNVSMGAVSFADIMLSVLLAVCFALVVRHLVAITKKQNLLLFLVGLSLLTGPAALISLSVKFQSEQWVNSSYGYIPAVIETMGLGIILVSACVVLFQLLELVKWKEIKTIVIVLMVVVLVPAGIYQRSATRDRYQAQGEVWTWFHNSLSNGLLDGYSDDGSYVCYYEVWGGSDEAQTSLAARYTERKLKINYYENWRSDSYDGKGLYAYGISTAPDNDVPVSWAGEAINAEATLLNNVRLYVPEDSITPTAVISYGQNVNGVRVLVQKNLMDLDLEYDNQGGVRINLTEPGIIANDITLISL